MTDGKNFFDQPISSKLKTYENIRIIATGKGDDYTTGCLLNYSYFKGNYKIIAIDLSKQQVLDVDPRAIHQINFTVDLDRAGNANCVRLFTRNSKTIVNAIILCATSLDNLISINIK